MATSRDQSIDTPQRRNWRAERLDRGLGGLARMLAGADRVVLGGQAEGVVAHRMQHPEAVAPAKVRHRVADGVDLQVTDVRLARGIGQHLQHVALGPLVGLVADLPGALLGPQGLPPGLDLLGFVAVHTGIAGYLRGFPAGSAATIARGMSARPTTRAADVAARQVEQIVAAAQEAADQIREEARAELQEIRARGEREVQEEMNRARKEAILLSDEAKRDAEGIVAAANAEATKSREQTERAVQGRVAAAEKAAADVLEEARALSGGLQQLGRSLESQADRILRDVAAAHKRMQADLRIAGGGSERARDAPGPAGSASETGARSAEDIPPRRRGANPFVDIDVPSWEQ